MDCHISRLLFRDSRPPGFTLLEILVAMALTSLLFMSVPRVLTLSSGLRVRLAAWELVGALRLARASAISSGANVGVKFRTADNGSVSFTLYRDGDGDGVRTRDIDSGVDPLVGLPRELHHFGRGVYFGFPAGIRPRDPGDPRRRLGRLQDPVRFNRSDLASFGPLGGSTPGSLYLTDGHHHLVVVRVFGRTGKVKILRYDTRSEKWW
jgi:prepilin-type N-terminal cleavage/methylation domain-containing protein